MGTTIRKKDSSSTKSTRKKEPTLIPLSVSSSSSSLVEETKNNSAIEDKIIKLDDNVSLSLSKKHKKLFLEKCSDIYLNWGATVISVLLAFQNHVPESELECRLGMIQHHPQNYTQTSFQTGVDRDYFNTLLTLIRQYGQYEENESSDYSIVYNRDVWKEDIVYYYMDSIRSKQSSSSNKEQYQKSNSIYKFEIETEENIYDLRISLKNEQIISIKDQNQIIQQIRFKSRQTYRYPQYGFQIDFTVAHTKIGGETESKPPLITYEIEMEVVPYTKLDPLFIFAQMLRLLGVNPKSLLHLTSNI